MKRFTLFLMAALMVAATSLAKTGQQSTLTLPGMPQLTTAKKAPAKKTLQQVPDKRDMRAAHLAFKAVQKNNGKQTGRKLVRQNAIGDPLISEQPAGQAVCYVRESDGYAASLFGVLENPVSNGAAWVVFGANNTVYFKDLISGYACDSWTKGTISDNGEEISIEFPQPAMEYYGETYYNFLSTLDMVQQTFVPAESQTLTLKYDKETGAITPSDDFASGVVTVALCSADGEWSGYCDWNISLTKQTDELVAAPEGLQTAQYALTADGFDGTLVNVGFSGNDVYVQGICADLPETWVKGTINGDKVTFAAGQYLGASDYHLYLMPATAEVLYDEDWEEYYTKYTLADGDITFDYDAAAKTLSNSSCFLINAGKAEVYYVEALDKAAIKPFTEVAATPAAPENLEFNYLGYIYYDYYGYGWGSLNFDPKAADVDGNYILPEKLSYVIYTKVNGEVKPLKLTTNSYVELDEDMTELPYGFGDGWDINIASSESYVYLYVTGANAYGVQAIYRGAGVEKKSDIVWVETGREPQPEKETAAYPELDPANVGGSIAFEPGSGNFNEDGIGDGLLQTYDVAMKVESEDVIGTHIDAITVAMLNTEGVSNFKVWLSTQLRVEEGKNQPNLVEIPVENPEAGFITVNLEKPYTISDKGVYVGYSFDITDASIEGNKRPVLVYNGATPGGLYLHTSDIYLSWCDMAEEIDATAAICLTVSGKSISANAATPVEGKPIYAKTGDPVAVTTTVANYGSEGISSLDIDYTLAGVTTSKHIDLGGFPVGAYVGLTTQVRTELPAVNEAGTYDLVTKIVKVNGEANTYAAEESVTKVYALDVVPKHRAVVEEYTGTWCGYCPRGFVGLEKMASLYPEDFIALSYHNGDPMECFSRIDYPSVIDGFPFAWLDRVKETDAYCGDGAYGTWGIEQTWLDRCNVFAPADIEVTATWANRNMTAISVEATAKFAIDVEESPYLLSYALVANGLTGNTSDWLQSNYYAGELGWPEDMDIFVNGESYVEGLVFNDVIVARSDVNGKEESLPTTIQRGVAYTDAYRFATMNAKNLNGETVIQDKNNLVVVALLINKQTGEIVNANKTIVSQSTGISNVNGEGETVRTVYHDMMGRRVLVPQNGIYLKSTYTKDGQVKTKKVSLK